MDTNDDGASMGPESSSGRRLLCIRWFYSPVVTLNSVQGPWIHIHAVPDTWGLNQVQDDGDVRARHLTVLREPVENLIKRSVSAAQG